MPGIRSHCVSGLLLLLAWSTNSFADKLFDLETFLAMKQESSITVSPDGEYIAFIRYWRDLEKDESDGGLWMMPTAGGEPLRMSGEGLAGWSPKWSPNNRYLAVLSGRGENGTQVWLYDRRGGDAQPLTDIKPGVRSFEWSPDSSRLALTVMDPSPADLDETPLPNRRPYVIDRLQFKRDYVGYLDNRHTHIYVFDIAERSERKLTSGDYDHSGVRWSPDGEHIIFVSNRSEWPDSNRNTDIWRIPDDDESPDVEPLTTADSAETRATISPDGTTLAYTTTEGDSLPVYAIPQLALLDLDSGESQIVESLAEVQVWGLQFSADSRGLYGIAEYRGEQQLVRVDIDSGDVERVIDGDNSVLEFDIGPDGEIYAIVSRPQSPRALYKLVDGELQLMHAVNSELMADVRTGKVEKHQFTARDGAVIDTFVVSRPTTKMASPIPACCTCTVGRGHSGTGASILSRRCSPQGATS